MHTIYIDFKDRKGPTIIDSLTLSPAHAVGPDEKKKAQNTDFTFVRRRDDYSQDLNRYFIEGTLFPTVDVKFVENGKSDSPKLGYGIKNAVIKSFSPDAQTDTVGVVCESIERIVPPNPPQKDKLGYTHWTAPGWDPTDTSLELR